MPASDCRCADSLCVAADTEYRRTTTPHDGNSPYKRPPVSPPVGVRGFSQYHSDPAVRYIMAHGQPQQQVNYGPAAMYRDNYQAERASAIESAAQEHQQQYSRENEHPPPQSQPQQSYQQMTGRRRPSLLPPSADYAQTLSRERHLEGYSTYYERDLNAPTVISSHSYPMVMGGSMDSHQEHMMQKRPRLNIMQEPRSDSHRQLGIDTDIKREPAYNPQVEAISPTLPPDDYHQESSPLRASRDDLLQQITKVDREIARVEQAIVKLKKKQHELEAAAAKPDNGKSEVAETNALDTRHQSVAQIIYAENRKKSQDTQETLEKLGPKVELPLYNQPSDTAPYHENKKKSIVFKRRLVNHFKKRRHEQQVREKYLTDTYNQLMQQWIKKVERIENNVKKKAKEIKVREFYEKQFPELKKQREDKERFSRVGTRIRSDAELEEIMDGLQEQEQEEKKMRNYAVIPPILLDTRQKKIMFLNENSLVEDPMADYKERQLLNIWSKPERDIFKEKYLQHPKNFGLISSHLEKKSVADCVQYYYLTKKNENYKQLLRKHSVRKKRFAKPQQPAVLPPPNQSAGVMTRQGASTAPTEDSSKNTAANSGVANAGSSNSTGANGNVMNSASGVVHGGNNNNGVVNSNCTNKELNLEKEPQQEHGETADEKMDVSVREAEKDAGKDDESSDEQSDDNDGTTDSQGKHGGPHQCAVCKTQLEHYGQSRAVSKSSCHLYSLKEDEVTPDTRVCSTCRCKSVRSRYTHCPILSCRTPKRRVKRLRPLPGKWPDLPPEVKDVIVKELQIPSEVTKCCSACFNRITRRLSSITGASGEPLLAPVQDSEFRASSDTPFGSSAWSNDGDEDAAGGDATRWSEEEMEMAKRVLREHGTNWSKMASVVATKTEAQCKNFYFNYRRKLGLDSLVSERKRSKGGSDKLDKDGKAPPTVTDEEESGETTSSCEEFNGPDRDSSDTASAPSPANKNLNEVQSGVPDKSFKDRSSIDKDKLEEGDLRGAFGDEPVLLQQTTGLSVSRTSLKSNTDYDSSATVSADEGGSQLDSEMPSVNSASGKTDRPKHHDAGGRFNSGAQMMTSSLLDESRVKVLLNQANVIRTDSRGGPQLFMPREQLQPQPPQQPMQQPMHGGQKQPDRPDLEPGEHIFTKSVRDLIEQAIDTSFPNGSPGRTGGAGSIGSHIPNIQDILRSSAKPSAMKGSRPREQQQQQAPPQAAGPPMQQYVSSSPQVPASHGPAAHMAPAQQQQQPPPPQPAQHQVQPSLMYAPQFHHHPPHQHQPHQPHAPTPPRGYLGPPPPAALPTVNLYIPDSAEQYKAEDLSMKRERPSPSPSSTSAFRMSPSVPQKPPPETPSRHLPHHGHHHASDRNMAVPPPAHSNQYSRPGEAPSAHLPEPHRGEPYYMMRQPEPRTKSPSAFAPDRAPQPPPPPHVHLPGSQRASSPPHHHYQSQGRSPPSSSSSAGKMGSGMKGGGGQPPPLVNVGKQHHHPSLSSKQDKPPSPHFGMMPISLSGSITHGTPVNQPGMTQQHGVVPLSHPNTRYDDFLRQLTPPQHAKEGGSITLGTPVLHEPSSSQKRRAEGPPPPAQPGGGPSPVEAGPRGMMMLAEGGLPPRPMMYERGEQYYRRMSPPPAGYPYAGFPYARPPFATESQISSRQTIMTDYYISQQMQVRRSSGDKDSRLSPRARDSSPQAVVMEHRLHPMYPYPAQPGLPPGAYLHPDARLVRHPSSPIDVLEPPPPQSSSNASPGPPWSRGPRSSPSGMPPHSTPPPGQSRSVIRTASSAPSAMAAKGKMTGVIQSPKPASPRADMEAAYGGAISSSTSKGGAPSPRHVHAHGHDAFSALVDVAYAQSSSKDLSKHHPAPHHVAMLSHEQRHQHQQQPQQPGLPMGAREDKMAEQSQQQQMNKGGSFQDSHHSMAQDRHKYEMGGRSSADNAQMEEARERKMRAMYQLEQEQQQQHFVRPDYARMEAERMMRYKMAGGQPSPRDAAPDVDSVGDHSPMFPRGGPGGNGSGYHDPRRSPPPQDLANSRRASSLEAYSAYAARGATTFRQMGRDPSKLLFDSLEKDEPKEAPPGGGEKVQTPLTAANLIEAIISHHIDKDTSPPRRPDKPGGYRQQQSPDAAGPDEHASPYKMTAPRAKPAKEEIVVTIDDGPPASAYADRPRSRGRTPQPPPPSPSAQQQKFSLKEHIDAIITEDYHGANVDPHMAAMQYGRGAPGPARHYPPQDGADSRLAAPMHAAQRGKSPVEDGAAQHAYSWKLRRALQQDKEQQQQQRRSPPAAARGHLAPDERQIIRIAQPASPRPSDAPKAPGYQVEPISPPSGPEASSTTQRASSPWLASPNIAGLLTARRAHQPPDSSEAAAASQPAGLSPFENYVKHKIVEEMRKTSEEGQESPAEGAAATASADDRAPFGPSTSKYGRGAMEASDPLSAGPFPGPASQYVPGAIYHSHPSAMLHQMEPAGAASSTMPRPPYKRGFDAMEVSSGGAGGGRPGPPPAGRGSSISPTSSDTAGPDAEEAAARKRPRLSAEGHGAPESSSMQMVSESTDGEARSSSDRADAGRTNEGLSSASSTSFGVSASGIQTSSSSSSSSPDYTKGAEAQCRSAPRGSKSRWDDEVSSGKSGDKDASRAADSPQSGGEMVIDESAAIDSATSSKLEPVSPPPQEGISTSECGEEPYAPAASSSSGADGQSVSSTYPNPSISSTVSAPSAFPGAGMVGGMGGVSTTYTYPFSALSVRSLAGPASPSAVANAPSSTQPQPQSLSGSSRSNSPVSASRGEPAPLMSSQYEPLSDED